MMAVRLFAFFLCGVWRFEEGRANQNRQVRHSIRGWTTNLLQATLFDHGVYHDSWSYFVIL
jgi:hypothetical protein